MTIEDLGINYTLTKILLCFSIQKQSLGQKVSFSSNFLSNLKAITDHNIWMVQIGKSQPRPLERFKSPKVIKKFS
jgi:hypothetical protein